MLYYYISGADNILTRLNPVELVDKGQHEFGQYIIKQWEMNSDFNPYTHKRVVKVTMVLSRKIILHKQKIRLKKHYFVGTFSVSSWWSISQLS